MSQQTNVMGCGSNSPKSNAIRSMVNTAMSGQMPGTFNEVVGAARDATFAQMLLAELDDSISRMRTLVQVQSEMIERFFGPRPESVDKDENRPSSYGVKGTIEERLAQLRVFINISINNQDRLEAFV